MSGGKRRRRDPRAERRRQRQPAAGQPEPAAATPALPVRTIDDPACIVLAVPDLPGGRLSAHDRDVLGAAHVLADPLGGAVAVLALGGEDDFAAAGADRVMSLAGEGPEQRLAAVLGAVARLDPRHVLFPDTTTGGGDTGRRLAARLGIRAAGNVVALSEGRIVRRGNGGRTDFVIDPPRVLLLAPEAADPVSGARHEARPLPPPAIEAQPVVADGGLLPLDPDAVPLAEADFIVGGGGGVTDWRAFHDLALALGAAKGGSRVACDAGHLPRDRQVGASGTIVGARCYMALGISGAVQHIQGIAGCRCVVAVNTDPHAEMVTRADLSVIADAQQVMPALRQLIVERSDGD